MARRFFAVLFILFVAAKCYADPYAIVVSKQTMGDPKWAKVVNALKQKHGGKVFVGKPSIRPSLHQKERAWRGDLAKRLGEFAPQYIAFVAKPLEANLTYVQNVNMITRDLDNDPYGDAIWGIVTGYTPEDALRIVNISGFRVRNVLAGTSAGWLKYVQQGIATSEAKYNKMKVKYPDGTIVDTLNCPTDRTKFLVEKLNSNRFDIFITSGHANVNEWQLHYPKPGKEGFFRSKAGQVYGDPHKGPDVNINSTNPKIYFGLGNCYIGKISDMDCMVLAWIHSGGAYMYTGYVMPEGRNSYQMGGTAAYFFVQNQSTWPEAFYLSNQAILFDIENNTPGTDPYDKNYGVLYGDPGLDVKIEPVRPPLYKKEVTVAQGVKRDTITVRITMNEKGRPGFTGKWGNRHPIVLLPFRVTNPKVEYTDAYKAVVTDNFALLYVWKKGDPPLKKGEQRKVVFTAGKLITNIEEQPSSQPFQPKTPTLLQNYPNPLCQSTTISYRLGSPAYTSLKIYDITGRLVRTLVDKKQAPGHYTLSWDRRDKFGKKVASGVYICYLSAGEFISTKKMIVLR